MLRTCGLSPFTGCSRVTHEEAFNIMFFACHSNRHPRMFAKKCFAGLKIVIQERPPGSPVEILLQSVSSTMVVEKCAPICPNDDVPLARTFQRCRRRRSNIAAHFKCIDCRHSCETWRGQNYRAVHYAIARPGSTCASTHQPLIVISRCQPASTTSRPGTHISRPLRSELTCSARGHS